MHFQKCCVTGIQILKEQFEVTPELSTVRKCKQSLCSICNRACTTHPECKSKTSEIGQCICRNAFKFVRINHSVANCFVKYITTRADLDCFSANTINICYGFFFCCCQ